MRDPDIWWAGLPWGVGGNPFLVYFYWYWYIIGCIFHIMGCIFRIMGSEFYYWLYFPYYGVIFLIASVLFLPRPGVGNEMSPLGSFRFPPLTTVETPGTANGNWYLYVHWYLIP